MSDSSRSNRRDFLLGKSARDALQETIQFPNQFSDPQNPANVAARRRQAAYLEQYSKNAMACEFEIFFNMHQYRQGGQAVANAFALIDELEDQMTVYRTHSEISQLNESALHQWQPVENRLFELLETAVELSKKTQGAFDITSAQLVQLWKFDRRAGSLPEPSEIAVTLSQVGYQHLELDSANCRIRFHQPGIKLNLGGIGKGHALDRVAEHFVACGVNDFVIHGGQSSVLAFGNSTTQEATSPEATSNGWTVGLTHPTLPSVRLGEICLRKQALGTSGTARQGFFHEGKRYGHIIDPRSGWPASHLLSTTVVTGSAATADALATAFFVMSVNEIQEYCERHPDVGAVLVLPAEKSGSVSVRTFNLDENSFRREGSA